MTECLRPADCCGEHGSILDSCLCDDASQHKWGKPRRLPAIGRATCESTKPSNNTCCYRDHLSLYDLWAWVLLHELDIVQYGYGNFPARHIMIADAELSTAANHPLEHAVRLVGSALTTLSHEITSLAQTIDAQELS